MSEPEKRTPISVYLTPRAAMILREYNRGSGYGSLSRTVEEIILAFDATYKTVKETMNIVASTVKSTKKLSADEAAFLTAFIMVLQNLNNAISRLQSETSTGGSVVNE